MLLSEIDLINHKLCVYKWGKGYSFQSDSHMKFDQLDPRSRWDGYMWWKIRGHHRVGRKTMIYTSLPRISTNIWDFIFEFSWNAFYLRQPRFCRGTLPPHASVLSGSSCSRLRGDHSSWTTFEMLSNHPGSKFVICKVRMQSSVGQCPPVFIGLTCLW